MSQTIAYLAGGKIHILDPESSTRTIESRFGQEVRDRAARIHRKHSWKTKGRGAQFMSGGLLWGGMGAHDPSQMRIAMRGLTGGRRPGELLYCLETDEVGGVFAVNCASGEEHRLFHSDDRRVEHLASHPDQDLIACAVRHENGTSSIAVMSADGSDLREVTEGDSLDSAPCWVPGAPRRLVFQSAGIGRDADGAPIGLGPTSIQELDLDRGELVERAGQPDSDLLGPRLTTDGELLCIRRPYTPPKSRGSVWRALLDFLLFPLRLIFALLQWFNFFTARYTGRPLTTAGGPKKQGADIKQMMIWGNLIQADKAGSGHDAGDDAPSLVPASWQLVRQADSDSFQVLAKGVLSFAPCTDGAVIYTNGNAIYRLDPEGKRGRLHSAEGIEQVALID